MVAERGVAALLAPTVPCRTPPVSRAGQPGNARCVMAGGGVIAGPARLVVPVPPRCCRDGVAEPLLARLGFVPVTGSLLTRLGFGPVTGSLLTRFGCVRYRVIGGSAGKERSESPLCCGGPLFPRYALCNPCPAAEVLAVAAGAERSPRRARALREQ